MRSVKVTFNSVLNSAELWEECTHIDMENHILLDQQH